MTPAVTVPASSASSEATADTGVDVVTGAFSYSGSVIAQLLLDKGRSVRTLTGHPERAQGDSRGIELRPMCFDAPLELEASLGGATTLYNTYWVRFPHGRTNHAIAVANSRMLFQMARRVGVQRIVHVSITHPRIDSPYPYFAGKAQVERALVESGVPYAIVRPSVLFGGPGVLLNNIAWLLRHLPVFAIAGKGDYRIRPIHVEDLANLCVELGSSRDEVIVDAVGPESLTFNELVTLIRTAVGGRSRVVHVPGEIVAMAARALGRILHDVLLSREELFAMMDGLADSPAAPIGETSVSEWIARHGDELGRRYANELDLHFR
jgi:NADH dehydrogenase